MKQFSKGAEAELFETEFRGKLALRKIRLKKKYRVIALDLTLRKRRTRREAKALRIARENSIPSPELFFENEKRNEIIIEKLDGALLSATKIDCLQARQAGVILGKLHNAGMVHGDFSTSNLINVGGRVFVIDFGLCEFSRELEQRADDAIVFEKSVENGKLVKCFRQGYASACKESEKVFERMTRILSRARYARTLD